MNPYLMRSLRWHLAMTILFSARSVYASVKTNSSPPKLISSSFAGSQQNCISSVMTDLQKYFADQSAEANDCFLASFVTSRSVTKQQRKNLIQQILQIEDTGTVDLKKSTGNSAAFALSSGFVLIQPNPVEIPDLIRACCTLCEGTIFYYPDPIDLQRGEGLLDGLGNLMESLSRQSNGTVESKSSSLYVLVPQGMDASSVQTLLERSINDLLPHMRGNDLMPSSINDVFQHVRYLSAESVMASFMSDRPITSTTPRTILDRNSQLPLDDTLVSGKNSLEPLFAAPQNMVVARSVEPKAREQLDQILNTISESTVDDMSESTKLIPNFGDLCDAVILQGLKSVSEDDMVSSSMGARIYKNLLEELFINVSDLFVEQMVLLQKSCWDQLKKDLSKVLISPNLQNDMNKLGQSSIATFVSDAVKLMPKASFKSSPSSISYMSSCMTSASQMYARKVQDYIANRILLARASGKFRPIPRKGVTVGFHWLLPKPFGNDYRQEPWMVHATDNMVYVPQASKLMDVHPDQVMSGEWKNQIVPHPPGNDMLYMQ